MRPALGFATIVGLAIAAPLASAGLLDDIERSIGDVLASRLEHATAVWNGELSTALLAALSRDLFSFRSRPFPYRLRVLDHDEVNAFALPGGHFYVLRGLLAHCRTVDELAGVLAHEVGHAEDNDFRRHVTRQLVWLATAGLLRRHSDSAADAALLAGVVNSLRHSRRQEAQADARAVELCLMAGYKPDAIGDFFAMLRRDEKGWLGRIFLTHPSPDKRKELVAERTALLLRSHPVLAWRLVRRLDARGRPATALALAIRCREWPAHIWWTSQELDRLRLEVEQLATVQPPPVPSPAGTDVILRRLLDDVRDDGRIRSALEAAQAVDPELDDWRYCGALSRTVIALLRLRVALDAGYEAAYRAAFCSDHALGPHLTRAQDATRGLRRAGYMLAAVLFELAGSGPKQPLGAISSAELAVIWGQIQTAEREIDRARDAYRTLAREATWRVGEQFCSSLRAVGSVGPANFMIARALHAAGALQPLADTVEQWESLLRRQSSAGDNGNTESAEDAYIMARLLLLQSIAELDTARKLTGPEAQECGTP
ncbi:MAG: M48 family metalloprotease [Armatimonadetes bacterium]|nr:M48 family metalloprotease [Armatimonadota bacterium]